MSDAAFENRQDISDLHLELEKPRIVQFPVSNPHVPQPEGPKVELKPPHEEIPESFIIRNLGRIGLVIGGGLLMALVVWASGPLLHMAYREISGPEPSSKGSAEVPATTPEISITSDMFRISSIALGKPPFALINGQRLTENDTLKIKTPTGDAIVRVSRIEDGTVRFKYCDQIVSAHISTCAPETRAH